MNSFHDNIIFSLNMRNRGSNIVLDTYIRYDEHNIRTIGGALVDVLEFVEIGSSYFSIFIYFTILKKKQLEKVFTNWKPGKSSLFRLSKTGKTWFR